MRRGHAIAIAGPVALAIALAGCDGCKGKDTSKRDAGLAPSANVVTGERDAAGPEAANELDVARYEDEVLVDHVPLAVNMSAASAMKSVPKADVVATLNHGDAVVKLAERNGFYRVTFADPGNAARRLMGWVGRFAFETPDAGTPRKKLALPRCQVGVGEPGTALVVVKDFNDEKPRCAYVCKVDRECVSTGGECEAAIVVPASGELTSNPMYTTVCTEGAAKTGADSGVPSLFGVPHASNGKCPPKFAEAPKIGTLCFRTCTSDIDCPESAKCKSFPGSTARLCSNN